MELRKCPKDFEKVILGKATFEFVVVQIVRSVFSVALKLVPLKIVVFPKENAIFD